MCVRAREWVYLHTYECVCVCVRVFAFHCVFAFFLCEVCIAFVCIVHYVCVLTSLVFRLTTIHSGVCLVVTLHWSLLVGYLLRYIPVKERKPNVPKEVMKRRAGSQTSLNEAPYTDEDADR